MRFWDSSVVVALLVSETTSSRLLSLLEEDPAVVAWWGTPVECVSAIARLEREGALPPLAAAEAVQRLETLRNTWDEIQPGQAIRETAERLLRVHPLRAADSLQLAAGIVAANYHPSMLSFVCNDERLSMAARREGFPVLSF